jgi:segregation and condensation protein A
VSTSYIVRTPEFEGPFDLLLHLIARQKVDLMQVSLARITDDYLAELRRMQEFDLEVATEFLVVAATLIELKAARLLPGPDSDDPAEALLEERDLLFARLLQYQAYKQVAGLLAKRIASQAGFAPRTSGPEEFLATLTPNLLASVTPVDLARAAARALSPAPPPSEAEHIAPPPRLSLAETVHELLVELERLQVVTFHQLVGVRALPVEVVVRFLALLELYKRSAIELEQAEPFADIDVRWTGQVDAGQESR